MYVDGLQIPCLSYTRRFAGLNISFLATSDCADPRARAASSRFADGEELWELIGAYQRSLLFQFSARMIALVSGLEFMSVASCKFW